MTSMLSSGVADNSVRPAGLSPADELLADHDRLRALAGDLQVRLYDRDDEIAAAALRLLADVLLTHVEVEEQGLFPALRAGKDDRLHLEHLAREHAQLGRQLTNIAGLTGSSWRQAVRRFLDALDAHMYDEEDRIFRAAVEALDDRDWARVSAVRVGIANRHSGILT